MPPEYILWDGTSKDIDNWIDKVLDKKGKKHTQEVLYVDESEIE